MQLTFTSLVISLNKALILTQLRCLFPYFEGKGQKNKTEKITLETVQMFSSRLQEQGVKG